MKLPSEPERPLIAVSVAIRKRARAPSMGGLAETGYVRGAEIAGGNPVILSPDQDESTIEDLMGLCSGVILTGGEDVHPDRYQGDPESAGNVSVERDALEARLIDMAVERDLPILLLCRGIQILNVVLGGTLYEDLPGQGVQELNHDRTGSDISREIHQVRVDGADRLEGVFEDDGFRCNSTHHQAIRELGEGLVAVGWSEDGIIEAVEYRGDRTDAWIAGVQWHPERMLDERTGTNRRLFERFGEAVRASADERR